MENTESTGKTTSPSSSKTLIIVIFIIILVIVGIGGYMMMGNKSSDNAATTQSAVGEKESIPKSIFSSVKDALSGSVSLECIYTDENGTSTATYIKNGAIRSDFTAKNIAASGSMIMKDNKMYIWNGKTGMMMEYDPSAMTEGVSAQNVTPGQQKPEDVVAALEKYKHNCKSATVSDSLFVPPTDVEFTDASNMIKGAQTNPGGAMTQEQIEALQKQYEQ